MEVRRDSPPRDPQLWKRPPATSAELQLRESPVSHELYTPPPRCRRSRKTLRCSSPAPSTAERARRTPPCQHRTLRAVSDRGDGDQERREAEGGAVDGRVVSVPPNRVPGRTLTVSMIATPTSSATPASPNSRPPTSPTSRQSAPSSPLTSAPPKATSSPSTPTGCANTAANRAWS